MEELNKEAALHSIVKESIINMIKSGEYQPNTKLPTEAEFCKTFGVSRTTIRTALQQLTVEGYVYRVQGKGTFVAENKVKQSLTSTVEQFSEQIMMQGKDPSIKVLQLKVIEATDFLAKQFKQKIGDPVNCLERMRYVNNAPLQYEISYLPWYKVPGLDSAACERSLYKMLETKYNIKISKTVEHLELILADDTISRKLEIPSGSPCFSLETFAYADDETAIEYSRTIYRGDRAHFIIERNY
ncbi:GntR family transcriptional regulator [Niallia sp. FSL W8-0635]|uniref:GntR family transcriptional regulator n=1 Tax=Niallia sp. FSL W8-0635 TaxID=2975337 RepID=UPI0009C5FE78|nr:regulatory protein GntR [Mycobacteroides abscessus subsp. abscessus]HEO8422037.1 GntR family transcriptional regulator [Yersinia enterocolitica]